LLITGGTVKIGVLGWDHGEEDIDAVRYTEFGRERGHETVLFTLEDIRYEASAEGGFRVFAGDLPAEGFDAVISRARLHAPDWRDREERLAALSHVVGAGMFDPVEVALACKSKLLSTQRLAAGGVRVPPTRSVRSLTEVAAAAGEWGEIVLKPSHGYSGEDVERIADPVTGRDLAEDLLARHGTLLCMPFWPTRYGEYRVVVAGQTSCICTLKLPPTDTWRCNTHTGATYERVEGPPELVELACRAARLMNLTLAGIDALPTGDGYVILDVNSVPGGLHLHGREAQTETVTAIFGQVEKYLATR
jgi:ribosomal protein S6--L-glutamate ligase